MVAEGEREVKRGTKVIVYWSALKVYDVTVLFNRHDGLLVECVCHRGVKRFLLVHPKQCEVVK